MTVTHREPQGMSDKIALSVLRIIRASFDAATGYNRPGGRTPAKYLTRFIVLETVAGIPGMVAAVLRHIHRREG